MSKDPIAWLRELERAATKGPWEKYAVPANTMKDARLIAAARNLLPVLVDVLEGWKCGAPKADYCGACGSWWHEHIEDCEVGNALAAIRVEQERQS